MRVLRVLNQAGDGRQRQRGKRLRAIQAIDDGECCIVWVLASVQGQMVSSSPVQLDYSASTRNHRTVKKVYPGTMSHRSVLWGEGWRFLTLFSAVQSTAFVDLLDMSKLILGLCLKFPLQALWAEPFCILFILCVCSCYMHSPFCIFVILTFKFLLGSYSICVI